VEGALGETLGIANDFGLKMIEALSLSLHAIVRIQAGRPCWKKFLEAVEAVPAVAELLAGLADVAELAGELQQPDLGANDLPFLCHLLVLRPAHRLHPSGTNTGCPIKSLRQLATHRGREVGGVHPITCAAWRGSRGELCPLDLSEKARSRCWEAQRRLENGRAARAAALNKPQQHPACCAWAGSARST
jgi:hypothetical protein